MQMTNRWDSILEDYTKGIIPERYFWMFKIGVKGKGYDYIGDPPPPSPVSGGTSGSAPLCEGSKGQPRKIISSPHLSSCVLYKKLTFNLCLYMKIYLCKIVDYGEAIYELEKTLRVCTVSSTERRPFFYNNVKTTKHPLR